MRSSGRIGRCGERVLRGYKVAGMTCVCEIIIE